jgi:hypothetical protein
LEKALERLGKQNIELKECQYEAVKAVVVEWSEGHILRLAYWPWKVTHVVKNEFYW